MDVRVGLYKERWALMNWCFSTVVLQKNLESPLDSKEIKPVSPKVLNILWKDWCWSWNSNPLTTWCKELTYLKRPWCWERLKVGREGDDMIAWHHWLSRHHWLNRHQLSNLWELMMDREAWCAAVSRERVRDDWVTELNWCRSWTSNTLATWCEELTHWKRLWCWENLRQKEKGWQLSMRWLERITNSIDLNLNNLWKTVEDRGTW